MVSLLVYECMNDSNLLLLAVIIRPDEKTLPARLNMEIIDRLQTKFAPQVFTPRAVYDGRKNLFAARELPFGEARSQEVRASVCCFIFHPIYWCYSLMSHSKMLELPPQVVLPRFTRSSSPMLLRSIPSMYDACLLTTFTESYPSA